MLWVAVPGHHVFKHLPTFSPPVSVPFCSKFHVHGLPGLPLSEWIGYGGLVQCKSSPHKALIGTAEGAGEKPRALKLSLWSGSALPSRCKCAEASFFNSS